MLHRLSGKRGVLQNLAVIRDWKTYPYVCGDVIVYQYA